tara:strand:- start:40052 stop:41062 length:1011 start_codon:yes stop_codon:yes gene_type:complete
MAVLFFDGCGETYPTADIKTVWQSAATPTVVAGTGRRGGACIAIGSSDNITALLPNSTELIIGSAIRPTSGPGTSHIIRLFGDNDDHVSLQFTNAGAIEARRGVATVLATSANAIMQLNVWTYIEFRVLFGDTAAGEVEIRANGVQVAVNLACDTKDGATDFYNRVNWAEFTQTFDVDDVYIVDTTGSAPYNTWLGDVEIEGAVPDGVGATSGFGTTFGSATHYLNVDEAGSDGDTTYNQGAAQTDTYTVGNVAAIAGGSTVLGVKAVAVVKKVDAGLSQVQMVARPLATDRIGLVTHTLPTDYVGVTEIWADNPEVSAPWTDATFNASEFGVKVL